MSIAKEAETIMEERFGGDTVIALATSENDLPSVRYVNTFYEDGAFYVLTYALSNKMKQLRTNPSAAIAAEWFTANAVGENLGFFSRKENEEIARKMKVRFREWIDNGHSDLTDENTVILKLRLTNGVLFSHGTRYDLLF